MVSVLERGLTRFESDDIDPERSQSVPPQLHDNNAGYTARHPVEDEQEVLPPEPQRAPAIKPESDTAQVVKVVPEKAAVTVRPPDAVVHAAGAVAVGRSGADDSSGRDDRGADSASVRSAKSDDASNSSARENEQRVDQVPASRNTAVSAAVSTIAEKTDQPNKDNTRQAVLARMAVTAVDASPSSVADSPRETRGSDERSGGEDSVPRLKHDETAATAKVEEAAKTPELQAGNAGSGDKTPPRDRPAPGGESDSNGRRDVGDNLQGVEGALLEYRAAENYDNHFSSTVTELATEIADTGAEAHPDFLLRESDGPALFRVGTNDDPEDKAYAVRILSTEEIRAHYDTAEVLRYRSLLDGPSGDNSTYGIGEQLVAYDPVLHRAITQYVKDMSDSADPSWERIDNPAKAVYMLQTMGMNMPGLHLATAGRYPSAIPLPLETEKAIIHRARDLVDVPYGQDLALTHEERAILRGLIEGGGDTALAASLGVSPSTVQGRIEGLRARFGATNRMALVYSAYLHGVDVGAELAAPAIASMRLTPSQALQYYLAATGWEEAESADLLEREHRTIHLLRNSVLKTTGASGLGIHVAMRQAIATGFEHGYFLPLPPEGRTIHENDPQRARYVHRTYATNMPDLSLAVVGQHGPRVPLPVSAQREIRERARYIVDTPYGVPLNLNEREVAVLQGYASGLNRDEIAERMNLSPTTVGRLVVSLHDRFGTNDPAALMYSALLHKVDLGEVASGQAEAPGLSWNEGLQFYLAATDHDVADASRLTGREEGTVKSQLASVRRKFDNAPMPRAVALAFKSKLFTPLP